MTDGTANEESAPSLLDGGRERRGAFTIVEVMVVLTMMAIMIAMAAPSFRRAMEKAKADLAITNLRAVWAAERFYWIDNRIYCSDLSQLVLLDLLDADVVSSASSYSYQVSISADGESFTATATRSGGSLWSGSFSIDQTGALTGSVTADGEPTISPPAQ